MITGKEREHIAVAKGTRSPEDAAGPRRRLADLALEFERRIEISATRHALDRLASPTAPLIEFAHDGQLPHLGIVRSLLKAAEIAEASGGVCLYAVGNHYTAAMRPKNLLIGMPLAGRPPEEIKHPLRLSVGKKNEHVPFRFLPAPSVGELEALERRMRDHITNNVAHERKTTGEPKDLEEVQRRLELVSAVLRASAAASESLGDCLVKVQWHLLREVPVLRHVVFVPMGELHMALAPEMDRVLADGDALADAKGEGTLTTFLACPACNVRSAARVGGGSVDHRCAKCGHVTRGDLAAVRDRVTPDIVLFQLTLAQAGVQGWVVGSEASYHPVIEEAHHRLLGGPPTPRFLLKSVPRFRGIGDPDAGYGRTRLLRALLEVEAPALYDALMAPWDEDPFIRSPHLGS